MSESSLSYKQFQGQLSSNTLLGNPTIMGTPFAIFNIFDSKKKYFYGELSDKSFRITKNGRMMDLCEFTINGKYSKSNTIDKTKVEFQVKPIMFGYLWVRLLIPIFLVVLDIFLLINIDVEKLTIMAITNLWLGVPWLFAVWLSNRRKKKMTNKFLEVFKISIE
jgi:hypothetical protein